MANRNDSRKDRRPKDEIEDQLVAVNRITKVVKGGRRMRFAALVVVGDKKSTLALVLVKLKKFQKQSAKLLKQVRRI